MPDITAAARAKGHESVVITDNLHGQTALEFCEALWIKSRSKMHLLPTGVTDLLQLIDAGSGYLVKFWLGEFHTQWGFKWPGLCASSCSNLKYQLCLFLFRVTRRGLVTVAASHIWLLLLCTGTGSLCLCVPNAWLWLAKARKLPYKIWECLAVS